MNASDQPDPGNAQETEAASCVERIREKAQKEIQSRWDEVASTTVGDLASTITSQAKKHPAVAMGVAAALGFFLGRLFRR